MKSFTSEEVKQEWIQKSIPEIQELQSRQFIAFLNGMSNNFPYNALIEISKRELEEIESTPVEP